MRTKIFSKNIVLKIVTILAPSLMSIFQWFMIKTTLTLKDLISSARRTKRHPSITILKRAITDLVHSKYVAIKIENKRHMLAFKRFACYEIYWSGKKVNR